MDKKRKNILIVVLLLLLLLAWFFYKRKLSEKGYGRQDPTEDEKEISCDKCNNGYPTSQMYNLPSCPLNTIPSGTGDPCYKITPTTTTETQTTEVVDTGLTPQTTINTDGGLVVNTGITVDTSGTAAPLTDINIDSTMLGSYGCMDVNALNYDPSAGVDDGSCYYTIGNDAWLIECCNPLSPNYSPTCASNPICQCEDYMC